jgi:quercetin dioxygenase-like cupin family protein
MNRKPIPSLIAATTLLLACYATSSFADATVQQQFAGALPNVPGKQLTAITVSYAPGAKSQSHHHAASAFLYAYVLSGHIRSQVEGEPVRVYGTGESWTEGPNAHHLISENASASEPAKLLVVFVADPDAVLTTTDR